MEFGVAAFSAAAAVVVSKISLLIEKKLKKDPQFSACRANARFIKEDLEFIQDTIARHGLSRKYPVWFAQLRLLAYDIEDCIDCFDANKMTSTKFTDGIAALKDRSIATTDRLKRFQLPEEGSARTTREQGAAVVRPIPMEVQNLTDYNLNCLLYLCLFPPNHEVGTNPLIRRWLAEGLVQGEQTAVDNFKVLTDSSVINSMSIQRSNNGKVKRCQPTGKILEYISEESISENFILLCDGAAQLYDARATRRLSVHLPANGRVILPEDLSHLRTLAVFPSGVASLPSYGSDLDIAKYEVLRLLDLKECAEVSAKLLKDIWGQVLMKYLSINLGSIDSIPRKIEGLKHLETLDLGGSKIVTVYKEVFLLPRLKHLLGKFQLHKDDASGGRISSNAQEFLRTKSILVTVAGFVTGGRLGFPQLMSLLRMLRKVKIWCTSDSSKKNHHISTAITDFIREGTLPVNDAQAKNRPDLYRSLSIDYQECSEQFLKDIKSDAKSATLSSLKLRGKLTSFPEFVKKLSSIKELCLWSTGLQWKDILEGLANLRILKYLKLIEDNLESIDIEPTHLRSIERICFVSKTTLDITIQAGALLHLVSLHILSQDLLVIPGTPGIEITHMEKLEEIGLHPLVEGDIKISWEKAARGHNNTPNILPIEGPSG
ncbi:unnamed protein product [Alopecurus aequalis]